jgi:hypothetical protein
VSRAKLSLEARKLFKSITAAYDLEDHHLTVLQVALEALDRLRQAQEALAEEGPVYRDRFGAPRKSPWVSIEENARLQFLRGMRELDLDAEAPADVRPPRGRSYVA